jgi:hypothetical protein
MKRRPDLPESRAAFAASLGFRYRITNVDDDYEEAMSILDEMATSGDSQDKLLGKAQGFAKGLGAALALIRSNRPLDPGIFRGGNVSHSHGSQLIVLYGILLSSRLGPGSLSQGAFPLLRFHRRSRRTVWAVVAAEMPESDETLDGMEPLLVILKDGDPTKIDEAIKKGRSIAASSHKAMVVNAFSEMLYDAFLHTKKIEYLNESIRTHRQMFESSTFKQAERLRTLPRLSRSLIVRSWYFPSYRTRDLDEALELISQCVGNALVPLPSRLWVACLWAFTARGARHPTVSTAYETALSLMQDSPAFFTNFAATACHSRHK